MTLRDERVPADSAKTPTARPGCRTARATELDPYYDVDCGESCAAAAVAAIQKWGDRLQQLPLREEQGPIRDDLYELLLLRVQARLSQGVAEPQELLTLLDQAAALGEPSRSHYRLQARLFRLLREERKAVQAEQLANAPATRSIALDYFLEGENYRTRSAAAPDTAEDGGDRETRQSLLAKAVTAYREALQLDPQQYWSHLQLGRSYLALGKRAESVEALSTCIALRPAAPWGYSTQGLAWALLGRFEEAERDLKQTIQKHPGFLPARLNYGIALWLQGQQKYAQALAEFAAVLQASPDRNALVEAAFCRGQIYLELADFPQALNEFDHVVAQQPRLRPVCFILCTGKNEPFLPAKRLTSARSRYISTLASGWLRKAKRRA